MGLVDYSKLNNPFLHKSLNTGFRQPNSSIISVGILSTIILGSVFNSIWIDLYMEFYNRKVYFWYDFLICFFLDHFVLGILILIIKSGILLRLIKIDNPESYEFQFAKKFIFTLTDVFIVYSLYE